MAGSRWHRLPIVVAAIVVGSTGAAIAQQQRELQGEPAQPEVVEPEVREEAPPVMVGPADEPQERQLGQDAEQLLTSLRRAQEALQLDNRPAAMQELMQAEEQLDQAAEDSSETQPWQQIDAALQDAMKALAEDNPKYALIALQRITEPLQRSDAGGSQEDASQGEQQPDSVLQTMSARDVIGAEVVNARGETIAHVSDIVSARAAATSSMPSSRWAASSASARRWSRSGWISSRSPKMTRSSCRRRPKGQLEEMPIYNQEEYEQIR